jgi:hypothetical protein
MHRGILSCLRRAPFLLLLASSILTASGPASADRRVALVIGNSSYKSVTPLNNPKNDARLIADTLRELGFTLVGDSAQLDLDKGGIDRAVQSFGSLLVGADVALFYYSGHGMQVHGANYLVPIDANPKREVDVDFQMLDAKLVLRQMEAAGTKLNLVILDACRNNPFGGRSLRAIEVVGLAQMQAPEGTLISFATQPGAVAQDGTGDDSPYTNALAQTIRKPGLGIFDAFNEVGLAVMQETGNSQQPWVSNSPIRGSFFFAGPLAGTDAPKVASLAPPPVPMTSTSSPSAYSDSMIETVRAFYSALAGADGNRAASLVIPEKRAKGPLSASAITKYYSSLSKPLQLVGLVSLGENRYQADYSYGVGPRNCHGSAVVTIVQRNGGPLVEGIKAPKDLCS